MTEKQSLISEATRLSETLSLIDDTYDQLRSLVDETEIHLVESTFDFLHARQQQVSARIKEINTRLLEIKSEELRGER